MATRISSRMKAAIDGKKLLIEGDAKDIQRFRDREHQWALFKYGLAILITIGLANLFGMPPWIGVLIVRIWKWVT